MNYAQWITDYGYLAVFFGSIVEGETIAFLAGAASHKHLLCYSWVVFYTVVGATVGDLSLYFVGRYCGSRILQRLTRQQKKIAHYQQRIRQHENWFILGMRFAYGFRIIGPIIIGASGVVPQKFILFNFIGAILWGFTIVTLGYGISEMLLQLLKDPNDRYWGLLLSVGILLILIIGIKWYRSRKENKR